MLFTNLKPEKKLVAEMPDKTKESMIIGQAWGEKLSLKVEQNLKEKGLID